MMRSQVAGGFATHRKQQAGERERAHAETGPKPDGRVEPEGLIDRHREVWQSVDQRVHIGRTVAENLVELVDDARE